MSFGKVINGRLAVRDGRLACDCCGDGGGGDDLPDWVDPDGPGGPGGPEPPSNPDGNPRCCSGDTICTATDDEPLLLGILITGSISNQYSYGSGPNAGSVFNYSADFREVFFQETSGSACGVQLSPQFTVTVPYRSSSSVTPADSLIGIRANGVQWDRNRGFYGQSSDAFPAGIFSGIDLEVGLGGSPIRGTRGAGYNFRYTLCRSLSPSLPINPIDDAFRLSQFPFDTLEEGNEPPNGPDGVCLNRVVFEYSNTFDVNTAGGDTNTIDILYRFYAYVGRITPCLIV